MDKGNKMTADSMQQQITTIVGFTTGNGESIINNPTIKNFQKFNAFINSFINVTGTSKGIGEGDECLGCSLIIIGALTKKLSVHTLDKLRNYVEQGGKLLVIGKCGVKDQFTTNIGELFKEIQPNKDVVLKGNSSKPLIRLTSDSYHFDESVIYDGGCTFSITGDVDLAFYLDDSYSVIDKPVWSKNKYIGHASPADSSKAIMVYKRIEKGAVLYWGARWSFSDEMFDAEGNSSFFRKMFSLIVGQEVYSQNVRTVRLA